MSSDKRKNSVWRNRPRLSSVRASGDVLPRYVSGICDNKATLGAIMTHCIPDLPWDCSLRGRTCVRSTMKALVKDCFSRQTRCASSLLSSLLHRRETRHYSSCSASLFGNFTVDCETDAARLGCCTTKIAARPLKTHTAVFTRRDWFSLDTLPVTCFTADWLQC